MAIAKTTRQAPVVYKAYFNASAVRDACAPSVGLFGGIQADIKQRKGLPKLDKLAKANKPNKAVLVVAGRRYPLTLDTKNSVYGFKQIGWNYKLVPLKPASAQKMIGKRAVVQYQVGKKSHQTMPTRIKNGSCAG